jgi:hypothetical protein
MLHINNYCIAKKLEIKYYVSCYVLNLSRSYASGSGPDDHLAGEKQELLQSPWDILEEKKELEDGVEMLQQRYRRNRYYY